MENKGYNYFDWFDEEKNNCANDVMRSMKEKNDEMMQIMNDLYTNEIELRSTLNVCFLLLLS